MPSAVSLLTNFIVERFTKWLKPHSYRFPLLANFIVERFTKWLKLPLRREHALYNFIVERFTKWLKLYIIYSRVIIHFIVERFTKWLKLDANLTGWYFGFLSRGNKQKCMESAEQGRTSFVLVRHKFGSSFLGGGGCRCVSKRLGWGKGIVKIMKNKTGKLNIRRFSF